MRKRGKNFLGMPGLGVDTGRDFSKCDPEWMVPSRPALYVNTLERKILGISKIPISCSLQSRPESRPVAEQLIPDPVFTFI